MKRPSIHVAKKVHNCEHCGFTHDSIMESRFCTRIHLEMRAQDTDIIHIDVFPVVTLAKGIKWKLDFGVWRHRAEEMIGRGGIEELVVMVTVCEYIDVKSMFYAKKSDFKLKRKLFDDVHPASLKVLCLKGKQWVEL